MPFSKLSSMVEPFDELEVSPGLNDPNWNDENCSTLLPSRILYVLVIYVCIVLYLLVISHLTTVLSLFSHVG